jgi:glycosyltransferase involved in cell wall biosynthesis
MKKNILYIHHDHGNSGASRSLSFLLDKINTEKYTAKVHSIFGGPAVELFKSKPVEIVYDSGIYSFHGSTVTGMTLDRSLRNFKRLPQSILAAYRIIKKNKPDIVHLNSSCLFAAALATKLVDKKIKVVCHIREPLLRYSLSASIIRYMNFHFVDHFIAIDTFSGSSMKTRKNINIVYNAVNFDEYHPYVKPEGLRDQLNISKDEIIFLYLARMAKSNGALDLIKTADKLTKAFPKFRFVLAGMNKGATDRYSKRVAAAAAANGNIHLLEFTSKVPALIAEADVLVVPFTKPHFARSIVESSAMGKPVIGANVGGVNELVVHGKTGFLYNNEDEFYNCCVKLGNDASLRTTMGGAAIEFAKQNFDNNISSKKVFDIYDKLLELE